MIFQLKTNGISYIRPQGIVEAYSQGWPKHDGNLWWFLYRGKTGLCITPWFEHKIVSTQEISTLI